MRLGDLLVSHGVVTAAHVELVLARRPIGVPIGSALVAHGYVDADVVAAALAELHGVPAARDKHLAAVAAETLALVPIQVARRWCALPIGVITATRELVVAMRDPHDAAALAALAEVSGYQIRPSVAVEVRLRRAIAERYEAAVTGDAHGVRAPSAIFTALTPPAGVSLAAAAAAVSTSPLPAPPAEPMASAIALPAAAPAPAASPTRTTGRVAVATPALAAPKTRPIAVPRPTPSPMPVARAALTTGRFAAAADTPPVGVPAPAAAATTTAATSSAADGELDLLSLGDVPDDIIVVPPHGRPAIPSGDRTPTAVAGEAAPRPSSADRRPGMSAATQNLLAVAAVVVVAVGLFQGYRYFTRPASVPVGGRHVDAHVELTMAFPRNGWRRIGDGDHEEDNDGARYRTASFHRGGSPEVPEIGLVAIHESSPGGFPGEIDPEEFLFALRAIPRQMAGASPDELSADSLECELSDVRSEPIGVCRGTGTYRDRAYHLLLYVWIATTDDLVGLMFLSQPPIEELEDEALDLVRSVEVR